VERLVAVLEAMYSPDSETKFLSYATNFLLEMTSRSPDYNREMFEQPLLQCKFQVGSARSYFFTAIHSPITQSQIIDYS